MAPHLWIADTLPESILKATNGQAIPLEKVSVTGTIRDFAAEISVAQHYRNTGHRNIEAVYTFPLPMGAVLLGLELDIGDRHLAGQVVERKIAEARYEDAITEGDTAVMVELAGPGLYTVNFGNLGAGESAVIRYRYALLLTWQDDRVRLLLPTTLAPRYGDPAEAGLAPHQVPETSLAVEYPFELRLAVEGLLARGEISCPTHSIGVAQTDAGMAVTLNAGARLDRDFVLLFKGTQTSSATVVEAGDGSHVVLASMRIPPLPKKEEIPLRLKIVIDCSGSMAGVSIAQARKAALEILNQLHPGDRFNITCFGSHFRHLWPDLMPTEARHIATAWKHLEALDADMGGTETGTALAAVYAMGKTTSRPAQWLKEAKGKIRPIAEAQEPTSQVLLITDGEVWDCANIVKAAKDSGHRVFTVGVGMAVAEGLVAQLAGETGGACELVTAQEGMSEGILAQFHRLRQPPVKVKGMRLGGAPEWFTPMKKSAFAGDTLHVYAGLKGDLPATVTLDIEAADGKTVSIEAPLEKRDWADQPRMAAAARIADARTSDDERKALALAHQLLTADTRYIVVAERDIKAEKLPELAKVPHMLAAGWGGTGVSNMLFDCGGTDSVVVACSSPGVPRSKKSKSLCFSSSGGGENLTHAHASIDKYEIPAFLRRQSDESPTRRLSLYDIDENRDPMLSIPLPDAKTPLALIANIRAGLLEPNDPDSLPRSIEALEDYGLPVEFANALREVSTEGWTERIIVAAFLMAMTTLSSMADQFTRDYRRLIFAGWKKTGMDQVLLSRMAELLTSATLEAWGNVPPNVPDVATAVTANSAL